MQKKHDEQGAQHVKHLRIRENIHAFSRAFRAILTSDLNDQRRGKVESHPHYSNRKKMVDFPRPQTRKTSRTCRNVRVSRPAVGTARPGICAPIVDMLLERLQLCGV